MRRRTSAGYFLSALMAVLLPLVLVVNFFSTGLLRLLGVHPQASGGNQLTREELKTLLFEAGHHFAPRHRGMLLRLLDLESVVVEDVMVHRNEVRYLDIDDNWSDQLEQLRNSPHTRLPVCRGSLDNIIGVLHLRQIMHLLAGDDFVQPLISNYGTTLGHSRAGPADWMGYSWFKGDLAEVVVYNRALSWAERIRVEAELGARYGRTLSLDDYVPCDGWQNSNHVLF